MRKIRKAQGKISYKMQQARVNTRARVLITYVNEYKKVRRQIENNKKSIQLLQGQMTEAQYKRKRLNNQNFSSAPHLKKTHKRYWCNFQKLKKDFVEEKNNLITNERLLQDLKLKVPQLRDQLKQLVKISL